MRVSTITNHHYQVHSILLELLLAKKKQTKKTQTNQTQCGAHKSASLNILVAVDDLLSAPVPSLACCDWWLRCLTWAVLCGWSSSPKYGLLADRYHFCEKCFNEIQGESVSLGDDPSQPQTWVICVCLGCAFIRYIKVYSALWKGRSLVLGNTRYL